MQIFWCRTDPWLSSPDAVRRFCGEVGVPTEDFFCHEDLVPHAAGGYLLRQGFRRYQPDSPMPPLVQSPGGRPCFAGGQPVFSVSHAGRVAICAFGRQEIGADIEEIVPLDPLPRSILHPEELAYLAQTPEKGRPLVFYQLWTQKESLLKAQGGVLADVWDQQSLITEAGQWRDHLDGFLLRRIAFPNPGYVLSVSTKEEGPVTLTRLELPV